MKFIELSIKGLYIIEPNVFEDKLRGGFFMEAYKKEDFIANDINIDWIQDNHSQSTKGVLRGLHFQAPPFEQDKLCRVVRGKVLDVAVDLRKNSPTYGKYEAVELSEENKRSFLVPKGFAHGFIVLSDTADFLYKVSNKYSKEAEGGIVWNDPTLNIDWKIKEPILNDRDRLLPTLADFNTPFL